MLDYKGAGRNLILLIFLGLLLKIAGLNSVGHYATYGLMVTIGNMLYGWGEK